MALPAAGTQPREAFILGAGFSKAISPVMPLTDELGDRLASADPNAFTRLQGGSFETWLSHRAEAQPYLDAADNLERQSVFARATSRIATTLDELIAEALSAPLPPWLAQLVSLWHLHDADVLTFNYDTLVECAFDTLRFWDWRAEAEFQWGSLLNYNPTGKAGSSIGEFDGTSGPHRSFRLWKLHGSTNWFWTPGDASGASAIRVALPGKFGAPKSADADERHWMAPGREPLLVPPSALKSSYYANPITREVWSRGYEALRAAEVITLIGYSLPQTDLTTVGMLVDALHAGTVKEVRVVDLAPSEIADRLRSLAPPGVAVVEYGKHDPNPAQAYVTIRLAEAAERAASRLSAGSDDEDALLLVTWGDLGPGPQFGRTAPVIGLHRSPDGSELRVEAGSLTTFAGATTVWREGGPSPVSVAELRRELRGAHRIVAIVEGNSAESVVIDFTHRATTVGQGNGEWIQLIPAGAAPFVGVT
ncbi:hypothetical protein [Cellulomonas sp. P24]|uniref:hypothetical protein n=1 Tax=Cellulomonas sp. P24 TaxID=2885206 RepID=UPI00216AEACA|nr:hypothetical protein [Cellulomonas sp. P24]MCR6491450.1 hypothetical protein [Cellulomonas sp. P24]